MSLSLKFIGITIPCQRLQVSESVLREEFQNTVVSWQKINETYIFYYKDRIADSLDKITLTENQLQHFLNTLKRVNNQALYNSYCDNFGLHEIS